MTTGLSMRRELQRKALHLVFTTVPLAYAAGAPRRALLWVLAALLAAAVAVEIGRTRVAGVRTLFSRVVSHLLRDHEHDRWSGATWLLVAMSAGVILFPPAVAIAALWAVAAGDAAAAIVGRAVGRIRLGRGGKTLEGSVACAAVTLAGALLLTPLTLPAAAVGAAAAASAELPGRPLDDNLRVVLATGAGILLWGLVLS